MTLFRYHSPLGTICYDWHEGICHHLWLRDDPRAQDASPDPVSDWLDAYFFTGQSLPPPPLSPARTTFQAKLRERLLTIPFGSFQTYGDIARSLGSSPRAVGQALGANHLPLIVPCHRILAARQLGGFSAGRDWKRRLVAFEKSFPPNRRPGIAIWHAPSARL